ncbi:MAG: DUF1153 domain-containing protein [Alphaproteobacteria bacterium]
MAATVEPERAEGQVAASADLSDLPPPDTTRWVARRKAQVVRAVRAGRLSLEQACERYRLSPEEFLAWERTIIRHGVAGLRVTRLKSYRGRGR